MHDMRKVMVCTFMPSNVLGQTLLTDTSSLLFSPEVDRIC